MGLATIDPHSQREHTKIHKIPKLGVNRASFTKKCKEMQTNPDISPDLSALITFFRLFIKLECS